MIRERKRITSLIMVCMLLLSCFFAFPKPTYAATVLTIPSTGTMVAKANKLKLSKDNYSVTWNITNHKIKTGAGSEKILCISMQKNYRRGEEHGSAR